MGTCSRLTCAASAWACSRWRHSPVPPSVLSSVLHPRLHPPLLTPRQVGGYIEVSGTSWRWTYYALTIFAGVNWLVIALFFPETVRPLPTPPSHHLPHPRREQYAPYILQQKAKRLRKETGDDGYWAPLDRRSRTVKDLLKYCLVRPFKMLIEEPMLMALTVYISSVPLLLRLSDSLTREQLRLRAALLGILIGPNVRQLSSAR